MKKFWVISGFQDSVIEALAALTSALSDGIHFPTSMLQCYYVWPCTVRDSVFQKKKKKSLQLYTAENTQNTSFLLKLKRKRSCSVRPLQPDFSVSHSLCLFLSVDGDSSLQSDKPLHCVPGPAAQHLPWLLADDMGAGLIYGGHADYAGRERAGT